ncbi:uncharacterized protein BX664DRAFT_362029 [Halteromyces radiatus]|uniref:uncharacterized protein n=1 Tax=Halteromyces radiatus TaxID=101107 RepID=UPI0022208811|nr:uncharacterized protein BX664DRAFT_362029 [Halteromyces radiatus]KAI8079882.1 hypothetical protein BX664DRAFT_362029 [Halteromyces radiatus]
MRVKYQQSWDSNRGPASYFGKVAATEEAMKQLNDSGRYDGLIHCCTCFRSFDDKSIFYSEKRKKYTKFCATCRQKDKDRRKKNTNKAVDMIKEVNEDLQAGKSIDNTTTVKCASCIRTVPLSDFYSENLKQYFHTCSECRTVGRSSEVTCMNWKKKEDDGIVIVVYKHYANFSHTVSYLDHRQPGSVSQGSFSGRQHQDSLQKMF